ncbi:carbon-nitrogen hydrolase family protein [Arthrobacter sp. ISL-48]|uniref:carbon-nitrogen hydrolase family protein n=1 Tax=Arthrobacter sp. ISL-48 TaxID=2819110 RepID=UPI001BE80CAA|nr:carbon-nitrogen hydrolase family protein [Arthrobacter sp. ISL-48]MBT2530584.1 carbon-nitrogen hydrolase family protein [Arthrobacter sp. ISL-48]
MSDALTVSAVQYQALDGGVVPNAMEHVRLIEDAESHGSRLVIFPELSLTGYNLPSLKTPENWLEPDDHRLGDIREICRRTGITAVVGAACHETDGTPRLASLAIHPEGIIQAAFKTHLHGQELEMFAAGDGAVLLELDGWKIALAICFDAAVPAHSAGAAAAGADAYAVSAVYTRQEEHRLALHLGARATDNRMFGVLANLGGTSTLGPSCGLSGFWGPDGLLMKRAAGTGAELVTAILQRSALRKFR